MTESCVARFWTLTSLTRIPECWTAADRTKHLRAERTWRTVPLSLFTCGAVAHRSVSVLIELWSLACLMLLCCP